MEKYMCNDMNCPSSGHCWTRYSPTLKHASGKVFIGVELWHPARCSLGQGSMETQLCMTKSLKWPLDTAE
uniref:Uncharacterized protein n=1 Tax=Aegilops tauschii subsp. strangulata TaxID=200361 RepID=A0A453S1I0_AEGTS